MVDIKFSLKMQQNQNRKTLETHATERYFSIFFLLNILKYQFIHAFYIILVMGYLQLFSMDTKDCKCLHVMVLRAKKVGLSVILDFKVLSQIVLCSCYVEI